MTDLIDSIVSTRARAREPVVGQNQFLVRMPASDFAFLGPHLIETVFDPGVVLQEPGQVLRRVYFPHSGLVSVMGVLPDGRGIDAATIGREGAIGLSAGLGSRVAVSRAVVQFQMRAAYVEAEFFAQTTKRSAGLRAMIACHNDMLLAHMQQSAACNAVHPVQARLCRWLAQARDRVGDDTLPVTQQLLSDLLGVQRTTVTIISRALQSEGIIDVRRGRIHIRDAGALEAKACGCYGAVRDLAARIGSAYDDNGQT